MAEVPFRRSVLHFITNYALWFTQDNSLQQYAEIRRNTQKHPSKDPKQYAEIRRNTLSNTPSKNTPINTQKYAEIHRNTQKCPSKDPYQRPQAKTPIKNTPSKNTQADLSNVRQSPNALRYSSEV